MALAFISLVLGQVARPLAGILHPAGGPGGDLEGPSLPNAPDPGDPVGDGARGRRVARLVNRLSRDDTMKRRVSAARRSTHLLLIRSRTIGAMPYPRS